MKPRIFFFLIFFPLFLSAQETAVVYFDRISDYYGSIRDYVCQAEITRGEDVQIAKISYKTPNLLHMEFSQPSGIVLNSNDEELLLFSPARQVTFSQELRRHSSASLAGMVSSQGLYLLKRNYTIGYLTGPSQQPLEEGSPEMVIKLRLNWKTASEGFREMTLSIGSNNLIRRIEAVTTNHEMVQFDFYDIQINQNLPDTLFEYDSPPVGNSIENFLFEPEE
ncbi:MAG: outer-membrane lipoprotein carrier protein LolA [Spirochaetaceae bacterium]|nr:outer-membrane lipoprotein carrier protein LolA [Spirochaetaceae bacterium]